MNEAAAVQPEIESDLPPEFDNIDVTLEAARLGADAEAFVTSFVGQFVEARSEAEIESVKAELLSVDPGNIQAVRDLQIKARVASAALDWLHDAIQEGRAAYQQLIEEDQNG